MEYTQQDVQSMKKMAQTASLKMLMINNILSQSCAPMSEEDILQIEDAIKIMRKYLSGDYSIETTLA